MKYQYITNIKGRKISVILPISEYEKMIEQLEELEDIKAYDEAIKSNEEAISANQAFLEIESNRHDLRN
jgi:cell fate (sporulation/competence/biofilm development) regulator YlbF (YheA/YmcA/DUF963 family)